MLVEVTATNSCGVMRPVFTPKVHRSESRSSSPPVPFGILVNGVAPRPTQVARTAHRPRQRAAFLDRMAVKRYGTPEDVTAAVAFLCSAENAFVAGQVLNVDGGFASSGVMYDPAEGA